MLVEVQKGLLERALRALEDAKCEIEAFEHDAEWYTASQKMMDRIEGAIYDLQGELET